MVSIFNEINILVFMWYYMIGLYCEFYCGWYSFLLKKGGVFFIDGKSICINLYMFMIWWNDYYLEIL